MSQIDIIADYNRLINDTKKKKIAATLQSYTRSYELDKKKSLGKIFIHDDDSGMLCFKDIDIRISNTLYRLHKKTDKQKLQYLELRRYSIYLFQYFHMYYHQQQDGNILSSTIQKVLDFISDEINSINDIDYYIELLFLPILRSFQDNIIQYLIAAVENETVFEQLQQSPILASEIVEIELQTQLSADTRLLRMQHFPETIRIWNQSKHLVEIPISLTEFLDDIESLQLETLFGQYDKSMLSLQTRLSLENLFVALRSQPRLIMKSKQVLVEHDNEIIKYHNSLYRLKFKDKSSFHACINALQQLHETSKNFHDFLNEKYEVNTEKYQFSYSLTNLHPRAITSIDEVDNIVYLRDISPFQLSQLIDEIVCMAEKLHEIIQMPDLELAFQKYTINHEVFNQMYFEILEKYPIDRTGFISISRMLSNEDQVSVKLLLNASIDRSKSSKSGSLVVITSKEFKKHAQVLNINNNYKNFPRKFLKTTAILSAGYLTQLKNERDINVDEAISVIKQLY